MIILQNQARHRRACTVFLVLSNDHAYWLRMHDDQIVDKYVSAEDGLVVRLLLDSPLDEIDRVSVAQTASSGANKWRSLRVLNRKKQEYAHSTVYALDKKYSPIIGSVLHHVVPPGWDQWLEHIQSRDVIVASVSNCIELMSRWSKSINHPVLLVQSSDTQQLQVLVENGSPVFSRQVDTLYAKSVESDDGCNNEELLQTIEFLKRNVLPDNEAFSVATLRSTRDASTCQWAHVYFLIDLLVLRESVVIPVPNFTEYWQPLQELVQDKDDTDSNGWPASVARFSLGLLGRLKRSMPGESSVEQRLWHGLDSLKISSAHWRSCTRLNYMRCVSLLFAASGVVCVALASVSGIASARIRTDQLLKQSECPGERASTASDKSRFFHFTDGSHSHYSGTIGAIRASCLESCG